MRRLAIWILVSCLGSCVQASAQSVLSTIAGYGAYDFSGDGGPAISAGMGPQSVVVDASGNLFFADTQNNRIRKVSVNGIITTVAGNGKSGFSGDGGTATAASLNLNYPSSVAVDSSSNLFIVDNNRIRKVSVDGIITTVAGNGVIGFFGDGGAATSAAMTPQSVAVDASGNLFIADNQRVRRVSAGGIITTVAGSGVGGYSGDGGAATSASLSYAESVAVDASGNLFIADASRIRKVTVGGIINTVAGSARQGFSGDGGPATAATLNNPGALALDSSGNLFIADTFNNRVRKVSTGGIITTVAGNGLQGFSGDLGPATAASLGYVASVAVATNGNLFIADSGNARIREVSASVPTLAATFSIDIGELSLYVAQGSIQPQPLQLGGVAGTNWQAAVTSSTGSAWLSLSAVAGKTPASLTAVVDASSLAQGSYQGSITIRAPGAVPPSITVNVSVQVYFVPTEVYQITNAASGYVSGENGFGLAQGSLFVIYGDYLGPAVLQQTSAFPIPLTLGGTSVQIQMSGVSYNAPMVYTSYSQVAAIVPSTVPTGRGTLVVTFKGTTSDPTPIQVMKSAFGVFTVSSDGAGPGVIQDINSNQLTFAHAAHAGDTVLLWGTGLGPVEGVETAGPLPGNLFQTEVFVGNKAAIVQYAGRSGCCAALDEVVFQIPSGVQGCFVPVSIRSNSVVSNFVSLPVAPAGEACSDRVGFTPDLLTKASTGNGLKLGVIALGPIPALQNAGFSFLQSVSDRLSAMLGTTVSEAELRTIVRASHAKRGRAMKALMKKYGPILKAKHIDPETIFSIANEMNSQGAAASFGQGMIGGTFASQFGAALPPPGTCTAGLESLYESATNTGAILPDDAGPQLLLTGPTGTQTLQNSNGVYQLSLGSASILPSGTYIVSGNGGADVGAFSASLVVGSSLTWTNKAGMGFVDRSGPLTITWSGGPPSGYVLFGGEGSSADGVQVAFACVADIRNQTLTVPDYVLSTLPHTSNGLMFLGLHPFQNMFTAPGIDAGYFANAGYDPLSIGFQ